MSTEYFQPLLNCSIQKSWLDHMMAHIVMSSDLTVCLRLITVEIGSLNLDFETRILRDEQEEMRFPWTLPTKKWLTVGRPCRCKTFLLGWEKTIQSCGILFPELLNFFFSFFLVFTHFCVELFSGQDEVRTSTSNLLHLSVGLSAIRPHALTTQPSRQLKVH